jgi:hypothetical protein
MSDYGDDNSDYGDEWMYVEEEYMVADDLAEHAVASPTLAACAADDDAEWDRFDYFNDLEYASDGYDDAKFEVHTVKDAQTGQKRKRDTKPVRSTRKRPRPSHHADGIATNQDATAAPSPKCSTTTPRHTRCLEIGGTSFQTHHSRPTHRRCSLTWKATQMMGKGKGKRGPALRPCHRRWRWMSRMRVHMLERWTSIQAH